ncbi:Piso0_004373 [Millerozyma farinosa CBS 7064]|uniref:2'-phosphotransferase n=1 Tax=Pichia sorbitophila (strain ATCC MYA-4447 / BCRC 22081 / CBS 7064 / NBRC 10061 / NRRL Y-12695) TaxID=559304 RepID=G8Y8M1_PICSO|nr:Piso0_004373 [Millerozyma farinosa CBS 7064]CCE84816.1 Piso0_004373 [Millerozyma farinosa CBS 7064]
MASPSPEKRDTLISKSLSYLLRHGAIKEKLDIDSKGYVKVSELLNHNRLKTHKTTVEDIRRVVENNEKKRFLLIEEPELRICATQGHSISIVTDENLVPLSRDAIPDKVYHGTYRKKLSQIFQSGGLKRMGRNHIHFASSLSSVSGVRKSCDAFIYIDVPRCLDHGLRFYKSENLVILTPGDDHGMVPCHLFAMVLDRNNSPIEIPSTAEPIAR